MLNIGDQVERYEVEAFLGEGGLARVYRVRHQRLGSQFALKVLAFRGTRLANRLLREGRIQARLKHRNVVTVLDVIEHDGRTGLLMEFVEGESLEQALNRRGAYPLDEALDLFVQVLAGVSAAHDAGVLHRDLKPGNILLQQTTRGMVAKVTDFGIARLLSTEAASGDTLQTDVIGTPGYMAPEQASDPTQVDVRADLFSMGAVLYGLVTGYPAFAPGSLAQVLSDVELGRFTPVLERMPDCPPHVAAAIERCLHPEPAERFASCRDLAAALYGDDSEQVASLHHSGQGLGTLLGAEGADSSLPPVSAAGMTAVPLATTPPAGAPTPAAPSPSALAAPTIDDPVQPDRARWPWAAAAALLLSIAGAGWWLSSRPEPVAAPPFQATVVAPQPVAAGPDPVSGTGAPADGIAADEATASEDNAIADAAPTLDPAGAAAPDPGAPDPGAPDPGAPDPGAPNPGADRSPSVAAATAGPGDATDGGAPDAGAQRTANAPATADPDDPQTDGQADSEGASPDGGESADPDAIAAAEAEPPETEPLAEPEDAVAMAEPEQPAPEAKPPPPAPSADVMGTWVGRLGGRPSTLRVVEQRGATVRAELEVLLGTAYRTFSMQGRLDDGRVQLTGTDPDPWKLDARLEDGALVGSLTPPGRKRGTPWRGTRQ